MGQVAQSSKTIQNMNSKFDFKHFRAITELKI